MTNQLVERGYLTQSLGSASHSGEHGFKAVPGLLNLVLDNRAWENRIIVETGEEFPGFPTLEAYITANPPKGLGANIELIDKLIGKDDALREKFYAALKRPVGRPIGGKPLDSTNNDNKPDNIRGFSIDYGTSSAYTLGTLKEKRPDMYERVQAGEMSPNAAMLKAGLRNPKISIRLDDPESAAKTLLTHASPEFLNELRRLLE